MYRRTQRSASIDSRSPVVVTVVTATGDRHVVVAGGMSIVGSDPAALAVVIDWSGSVVAPEEPFATFSLDVLPAFDAGRAHALTGHRSPFADPAEPTVTTGVLEHIDCTVRSRHVSGTSELLVGDVVVRRSTDADPLLLLFDHLDRSIPVPVR